MINVPETLIAVGILNIHTPYMEVYRLDSNYGRNLPVYCLWEIYKSTGGNQGTFVAMNEISQRVGADRDSTSAAFEYLGHKGLVTLQGSSASVTALGFKVVRTVFDAVELVAKST